METPEAFNQTNYLATLEVPKTGQRFFVSEGQLEANQIEQLITYSKEDESVDKFTNDANRFKDRESYKAWEAKGRSIYSLLDEENNLCGLAWLGKEKLPDGLDLLLPVDINDYDSTWALRIYERARGKGMAYPFSNVAIQRYARKGTRPYGVWVETSFDNVINRKNLDRLGFVQITNPNEHNKIILIN